MAPHQLDISNVKLTQTSCKIEFWAKLPENYLQLKDLPFNETFILAVQKVLIFGVF